MRPTPETLHYSEVLTNLSIAYMQSQEKYVGARFAPLVGTTKQSDKYNVFSKDDFLRDDAQIREDGKESAGTGFGLSRDSYNCELYAQHFDITPRMRAARAQFDLRRTATRLVTGKLLLKQEAYFVNNLLKSGVWTGQADQAGVASSPSTNQFVHWSNYSSGQPRAQLKAAASAMEAATGYRPNTLVLGRLVWDALLDHPDFADRLKYTSSESMSPTILARMLEFDRVMIAAAVINSAKEGQTASVGFMAGKSALLAYVNPNPEPEMPSAAYTFGWTDMVPGAAGSVVVSELPRDPKTKVDRIEAESAWDMKVTGADLGAFFGACVP